MVTTVRRAASWPRTKAGNVVVSSWVRSRRPWRRCENAGPRSPAEAVPPMTADAATAAPPTSAARRVTPGPVPFSSKHFSVHIALLPSLGPVRRGYFTEHPARTQLSRANQAGREAAADPAEEAAGALGPGALAHDPQPQLPAVAGDDGVEAVAGHAGRLQGRAPALPERVGEEGPGVQDRRPPLRVLLDQGPGALAQGHRLLGERQLGGVAHRSRGTGARSVPV